MRGRFVSLIRKNELKPEHNNIGMMPEKRLPKAKADNNKAATDKKNDMRNISREFRSVQ